MVTVPGSAPAKPGSARTTSGGSVSPPSLAGVDGEPQVVVRPAGGQLGQRDLDRGGRVRPRGEQGLLAEVKTGTYCVPSCSITGSAIVPSGGGSAPSGISCGSRRTIAASCCEHGLGLGLGVLALTGGRAVDVAHVGSSRVS